MAQHDASSAGRGGETSALLGALAELKRSVLESNGSVGTELRRSAFSGEVGTDLEVLVEKIRSNAYTVTDSDIARLKACGYSEDQIFEITIAAAVGAGFARLEAGIRAQRGSA